MQTPGFDFYLSTASQEAPLEVIRRIDELHAAEVVQANHQPLREHEGQVTVTRLGEAWALRDLSRPGDGRYNRIIGFRSNQITELNRFIDFYEGVGVPCQLDIMPSQLTPPVHRILAANGFAFVAATCTSAGVPSVVEPCDRPGVTVSPLSAAALEPVLAIIAEQGNRAPPEAATVEQRRAELGRATDFLMAVATVDGKVAAIGTLFFEGKAAYLGNAITSPAYRRRGCQAALLEYRLREAVCRGCDLVVTDTLVGNTSHRNVARAGLRTAFLAGWWVRSQQTGSKETTNE